MSKSVANESKDGHETREKVGKRGAGDEGNDEEEGIIDLPPAASSSTFTTVSTAPAATDQFMLTPEFRRHFVEFVPGDTLMRLRLATKEWKAAANVFIDEGVRSGAMIVRGSRVVQRPNEAKKGMLKLVTRVVFLLDITKVGDRACHSAINLVVVDIPEGVESIGAAAFQSCSSLTTVSFPTTLTTIYKSAFLKCTSLENVDLLHTNIQKLGDFAFSDCSELKSMTIPDSLQTLSISTFEQCSVLIPSNIHTFDNNAIVLYLHSKQ